MLYFRLSRVENSIFIFKLTENAGFWRDDDSNPARFCCVLPSLPSRCNFHFGFFPSQQTQQQLPAIIPLNKTSSKLLDSQHRKSSRFFFPPSWFIRFSCYTRWCYVCCSAWKRGKKERKSCGNYVLHSLVQSQRGKSPCFLALPEPFQCWVKIYCSTLQTSLRFIHFASPAWIAARWWQLVGEWKFLTLWWSFCAMLRFSYRRTRIISAQPSELLFITERKWWWSTFDLI